MTGQFTRKLSAAAFVRKTRLIIGLDLTTDFVGKSEHERKNERDRLEQEALRIINATAEHAVAFKFNRQLVLPMGLYDAIPRIIRTIHDLGLTAIMDCKINDIGNTNGHITRYYLDAGFDAVIANPFVGWESGLDTVFKTARERGKGVITLCYMSHAAADEGYGLMVAVDKRGRNLQSMYTIFARRALKYGADGVIVGATYPDKIREIRQILREEVPIIAPGVGAQGGSVSDAIRAGASYVIVARSIVNSENPGEAARDFALDTQIGI